VLEDLLCASLKYKLILFVNCNFNYRVLESSLTHVLFPLAGVLMIIRHSVTLLHRAGVSSTGAAAFGRRHWVRSLRRSKV
jgi:hypothetical protein